MTNSCRDREKAVRLTLKENRSGKVKSIIDFRASQSIALRENSTLDINFIFESLSPD
jgi:hypothetical protein